jgi:hypothetical protein
MQAPGFANPAEYLGYHRAAEIVMKLTINDREVDEFSPGQWRSVTIGDGMPHVEGYVLSVEEARAAIQRGMMVYSLSLTIFIPAVFVGVAVLSGPPARALMLPYTPFLAGGVLMLCCLMSTIKQGSFRAHLPDRMAALPPAGTRLRLDGRGISVGDRVLGWTDLRVSSIAFETRQRAHSRRDLLIKRLTLQAPRGPDLVLDRVLMQNGVAIVDQAYRRLCLRAPDAAVE